DEAAKDLIDRIFTYYYCGDSCGRPADTVRFFARFYPDMEKTAFQEIRDCIAWRLRHQPEFRMKGRTLSSMIKMTQEWHRELRDAKLRAVLEWPGPQVRDWQRKAGDKLWEVKE